MNDREMEEMLRGVKPAAVGGMKDRVMFEAGRASGSRGGRAGIWKAATGGLVVCVGILLFRPPTERIVTVEHVVRQAAPEVEVTEVPAAMTPAIESRQPVRGYLALRNAVLSRGADALDNSPTEGGGGVVRMKLDGSESLPAWQRKMLGS